MLRSSPGTRLTIGGECVRGVSALVPFLRGFLGILGWLLWLLPRPAYAGLVVAVAWVLEFMSVRRAIIQENLRRAFPAESDTQIDARVSQAYLHLAQVALELFFLFGPMETIVRTQLEVVGIENWRAALGQRKGAFFLSSHVGNWEIMVCRGGIVEKMDLLMVTKKLQPDWFHELFEGSRRRWGVRGTYEPKTLRDVFGQLRAGKTVGFVLDQYTGPPVSVRVPFFGTPVGTSSALATLVRRTEAPVVPVVLFRTGELGSRHYRIEIGPPLTWIQDSNAQREIALNTAAYSAVIEREVRAHPEQWLWSHRRFKGDLSALREAEWSEARRPTPTPT